MWAAAQSVIWMGGKVTLQRSGQSSYAGFMAKVAMTLCPHQEMEMNKDQVKGRVEESKGKVKEIAGSLVGNKDLEVEGKVQNTSGKIQAGYGDLKEDIKKAV